jgi:hypothetical protein
LQLLGLLLSQLACLVDGHKSEDGLRVAMLQALKAEISWAHHQIKHHQPYEHSEH